MAIIISFDVGLQNTGIVVAEHSDSTTRIHHMTNFQIEKCTSKEATEKLITYIKETLAPYITKSTHFAYENCVFAGNGKLLAIHSALHDYFVSVNVHVIVLQPSQKICKGTKKQSEEFVHKWIQSNQPEMLNIYESFKRKHDIADAMQMSLYINRNQFVLTKQFNKVNKALWSKHKVKK
jgi:hypothetical protein